MSPQHTLRAETTNPGYSSIKPFWKLPPVWLLGMVFLAAAIAAAGGFFWPYLYHDREAILAAWYVNDLVTFALILPLYAISWWHALRGNKQATLFLYGLLVYLFYNYAFYLFGAAFNAFFLLYVTAVAGSFYALAVGLIRLDRQWIKARVMALPSVRWVSAFLIFIALPLILVEGGTVLQYVLTGREPEAPSVIFAMDLTVVVPASLLGAILLWQRKAWGYLLAVLMSVKALTYGIVLSGMTLYATYGRDLPWDSLFPFYVFVTLAGAASTAYLLLPKGSFILNKIPLLRGLAIGLLLINGLSALFGGSMLTIDPSGDKMQMPLDMLHGIFPNFLIPGLILGVVLGIGSLLVAAMALFRHKQFPLALTVLGGMLVVWIIVQIIVIQGFHFLQAIYGGIGLLLLLLGRILLKAHKREPTLSV